MHPHTCLSPLFRNFFLTFKSCTPAELRLTCIELFGKHGWQIGLARFLKKPNGKHVNVRTVRRWWKDETPVPFWVDELLKAELAKKGGMMSGLLALRITFRYRMQATP